MGKSLADNQAKIDVYYDKHGHWPQIAKLRQLVLAAGLEETLKWGGPCYTSHGVNVVSIGAFKHHLALWFHQGALLSDPYEVLVNAQEGKTRMMRHWRFGAQDKLPVTKVRAYLKMAVNNAADGKKISAVAPKRTALQIPEPLQSALSRRKALKRAFSQLSHARQRDYCQYLLDAKRDATVQRRLAKILPMILAGVGLNDQYRAK